MPALPLNIAILLSGSGRSLVNLCEWIDAGKLSARIAVVVSSRSDAPGVARAKERALPTVVVERRSLAAAEFDRRVAEAVVGAELVCMAGFLCHWTIPPRLEGWVINIHPALLPDFGGKGMYGHHVHEAVLAAGRTESGCTVHFCDNEYDHGPIILQRRVPVRPDDSPETLAARVFEQECIAYPDTIQLFAEGRIRLLNGCVTIA